MIKSVDSEIELVACGSSFAAMPTFASWEAAVLGDTHEHVEYVSLHTYFGNRSGDLGRYLAQSVGMDQFIQSVAAICNYVKARTRSKKTMLLADAAREPWRSWGMSTRSRTL